MKKFGLAAAAVIAGVVLLANLGPMVGLAVSVAILYYVAKKFMKAETKGMKILWGVLGLIMMAASISNAPAIIGVAAAFVLYLIYKNWNKAKKTEMDNDPFVNFEREWAKLK
ncbi:lmo0954 family membrane protein [Peribacillus deserti]|uniref:Flagellar basal body rod protein n=1 Tax=Peribacillus deserti TaxID=673318 RepID=A0A2N5M7C5_9BACI|nr:flagellar basal body rod protein [Peribacillus deserti]PLT30278.1 flagellar basal body rod protein [Peribacillus deserti]